MAPFEWDKAKKNITKITRERERERWLEGGRGKKTKKKKKLGPTDPS